MWHVAEDVRNVLAKFWVQMELLLLHVDRRKALHFSCFYKTGQRRGVVWWRTRHREAENMGRQQKECTVKIFTCSLLKPFRRWMDPSCTHRRMDLCVTVSTTISVCVWVHACVCLSCETQTDCHLSWGWTVLSAWQNDLVCILLMTRNRLCKQLSICLKVITAYTSTLKANQLPCYV